MTDSLSPEREYRNGYLYSSKCRDTSGGVEEVKTLALEFDYEFALPNPGEPFAEVQWQDLPVVEFGMLHRMNQVTGVESCDFTAQLEDPWLQSAGSGLHRVVGLNSGAKDTLHPVGECRYINSLDSSLVCFAMRGKMEVFYTGPNAQVIEDYMMYHLRVELNSQNALVGSIYQTYFVGKSTDNPYNLISEGDENQAENPQSNDSTARILPLVMAVPIALALIVAIGLFLTRRKRKSDSSELQPDQADDSQDGESPRSSKNQPMLLAETDSSEKSEEEDNLVENFSADSIFDDVETGSTQEVGSNAPILMDLKASSSKNSSISNQPVQAQNPFESASSGVQESAQSGDILLPPLPPGVRPVKVIAPAAQPARRRRRKKKRKPVERSGREAAPEMETIQETPENSDNEDDESYASGSEQSWSGAEDGSSGSPEHLSPFRSSSPGLSPTQHPGGSPSFDETLVTDNRTFKA